MNGARKIISLECILNEITEEQILYYYLNTTLSVRVINSPLREDHNPSFGIGKYKGMIVYKDFATGDGGTLYTLLSKLFNLTFNEVLLKIQNDIEYIKNSMGKELENSSIKSRKTSSKSTHIIPNISVSLRQWEKHDLEYWEKYGISLPYLKLSNTFPVMFINIVKEGKTITIPADKYAYAFFEYKDGVESFKIYQPYNKIYKWMSKHDNSVWDLWDKLPKTGACLIITSSRKDALCIWENTSIPAISLQGEQYLPKRQVVEQLKARFKTIFVLYDNDFTKKENWGDIAATKLCETFELNKLTIPIVYGVKDTSDLCEKYGRNEVKNLIKTLLKKHYNYVRN